MANTRSGVRRVIITEGGKGGPGKTTVACSLIDFLDTEECPRVLIDCDIENVKHGSISHYFKEAQKLDISTKRGLDDFIDAAFTDSYEVVVADLGAGAGKWTFDWFDKMYEPMTEAGVRFLALGVVTAEYATVETLLHWAKALSDRVDYLVA
jgi:MinD-like ATPase involved in chromosome partitioning or flagellar assembly